MFIHGNVLITTYVLNKSFYVNYAREKRFKTKIQQF